MEGEEVGDVGVQEVALRSGLEGRQVRDLGQ